MLVLTWLATARTWVSGTLAICRTDRGNSIRRMGLDSSQVLSEEQTLGGNSQIMNFFLDFMLLPTRDKVFTAIRYSAVRCSTANVP